ncbi:MAG: ABC transporter permease, partial [Clostridia bacterium]|nr:ABC transporter permease [Clostridia bacterium]
MSDSNERKDTPIEKKEEQYSLNDDRRVKVLSPGAMVAKRFFRNRIAVVGLVILTFMFLFSFVGGIITPYKEDQQFYRVDIQNKEYAGAVKNTEFRYLAAPEQKFDSILQAQVVLATQKKADSFSYRDTDYKVIEEGRDFYRITLADDTIIG